jgi:hypothetical protein
VDGNAILRGALTVESPIDDWIHMSDWDLSGDTGTFSLNETNVAPRLTIVDGGNVGIGTTTPSSKLNVDESTDAHGVITIDSGSTLPQISAVDFADRGTLEWGLGKDGANAFYLDETFVGRRLTVLPGGNVGIGTSTPASKLSVVGSANISGDVTQALASDGLVKAACHIDGRGTVTVTRSFNNLAGGTTITANKHLDAGGNPVTGAYDVHFGADVSDRFHSATLGQPVYDNLFPPVRGGLMVSQVGGLDSELFIRCYDKDGFDVDNEFWLLVY